MFRFRKWLQLLLMAGFLPALVVSVIIGNKEPAAPHTTPAPTPIDPAAALKAGSTQPRSTQQDSARPGVLQTGDKKPV